ncbi:MAG: AI-2E family transporter [Candidatus Cloacimonetes bacterium]|nr:AI-2E family transporter [Candidatus Cloacimonadota bacterium]
MNRSRVIRLILTILSLALGVAAILYYKSIISYLLVGFLVSYLLSPIINYAERSHISRALAIIIVYVIILILLAIFFTYIIPQIIQQLADFSETIKSVLENPEKLSMRSLGIPALDQLIDMLEKTFPALKVDEEVLKFFDSGRLTDIMNQLPLVFKGVANILAFLVVVPVIVFFMLKDERIFLRSVINNVSNRYFEFTLHLLERIEESFGKFFRAILLETVIVAVMSIIGLLILGIPNALILGIIVGLANPIKYFGPFIGAVPTMLVILLGPTPDVYVFYSAIMYVIVQQVDGNILFPVLVGKSMDMHPMWVLLTVIAGGYAFGISGMLLGVPVVFLVKTIFEVAQKSLKEFEII